MASHKQPKKTLRRFLAILHRGVALLEAKDLAAASDKLLEAVLAAPSVWTKHRYFAFERALFLKGGDTHGRKKGDERDFKLLREQFIDNESEPLHFRAKAASFVATVKFAGNRDLHGASKLLRFGLHLLKQTTADDMNRQVYYLPYFADEDTKRDPSMKHVLSTTHDALDTLLKIAEGNTPEGHDDPFCGKTLPPKIAELLERHAVGGSSCDFCKKTLQEAQVSMFQRCARCTMTHYCSEGCQKEHWKRGGHKFTCRKKGQIVPGDDMSLKNMPEEESVMKNGSFVKVLGAVAGTKNLWNVKGYTVDQSDHIEFTVSSNQLRRLRPPPFVLEESS